jgi:hypothetical protein
MTEESGIKSVDAIANDDNELIKYAKEILVRGSMATQCHSLSLISN